MLKWTASAQKLPPQEHTPNAIRNTTTPIQLRSDATKRRCQRRATIANKENIPMITSTPMAATKRQRNSPMIDILNVTARDTLAAQQQHTPERHSNKQRATARRHSTLGIVMSLPIKAGYASTLPRYAAEEYSPSAALPPTGQQLALRGLLPDAFLGNPRYFKTPPAPPAQTEKEQKLLPKKRKLEQEFSEIAQETETTTIVPSSTRMGDQTLDHLIDAILDSARKEEKKRKPRKSFNLRRRTLLRNQAESVSDLMLSPSYTPCDDPADDLSFLPMQSSVSKIATPQPSAATVAATVITPKAATPPAGFSLTASELCQLPTPATIGVDLYSKKQRPVNDTFMLDTPVRYLAQKRTRQQQQLVTTRNVAAAAAKRYKVDTRNYFEIGLALPSIYV